MGLTTLLPETKCGLADRNRYGAWHRCESRSVQYLNDQPLVYRCRGAIKPGVAIRRSNLVSRDIFDAPERWPGTLGHRCAQPQPPRNMTTTGNAQLIMSRRLSAARAPGRSPGR